MDKYQKTIKKEILIEGIGLHSGEYTTLRLIPASENEGINFIKNNEIIPAKIKYASGFDFSTTIEKNGQKVQTIEHLMASLFFLGIDNIYIEINGKEIPILDGSAKSFIEKIKKAGIQNQKAEKVYAVLNKEILVENEDKYIHATISENPVYRYKAKYNNNIIGNRDFEFKPFEENYNHIADARTYCFFEEVEFLRQNGLARGGSLDNAVVFKDDNVLNPEGLRYEDEPVRHKLLDLIGDLYLLGYPIIADITSFKGGHKLNAEFLRKALKENAFDFVPASKLESLNLKVA
ncbi:UDP-3-O-acyl-N-acetylglucosamine deacetylase [Hydrogenothermus marinus]|uniref:UDP-3-O-acyl-N-acetylglucosamine deacetylase n=1 Tax=Hydrogenothermus marinus TaxID=133270 RepID=A0A3M0BLA7_9AQUI|nr:UDP-3-O-acyl-N-acetylglucosamine deacetylase [Hydrogenothermus marinus]RMA97224.1 UDP-3-O-[3-hydroxymyristoyl] N-acetylglucosamine deacetylase [Hydrogenothermus marinus]